MPDLINWELLSQPYNWIIVFLMLAIGAWGLHMIMAEAGKLNFPFALGE
jgi:hypothetical protein